MPSKFTPTDSAVRAEKINARKRKQQRAKKLKWIYDLVSSVLLLVILIPLFYVANYVYVIYDSMSGGLTYTAGEMTDEEILEYLKSEADETLTDSSAVEISDADDLLRSFASSAHTVKGTEDEKVQNILLIGCDSVSGYDVRPRSDSMIILTIDRRSKAIKMTSLMRDMRVAIPGHGFDKLNAAFAFDPSASLLLKTIEKNYLIHIDNYVCINYEAFTKLVDMVGGITVNVDDGDYEAINLSILTEKDKLTHGGEQTLNGAQALAFCRMRYVGYDMGRTMRQRQALTALMQEMKSMSMTDIMGSMNEMLPYVKTNLSLQDILSLAFEAGEISGYSIEQFRLPVDGTWRDLIIKKIWYISFDLEANVRLLHDFIYPDSADEPPPEEEPEQNNELRGFLYEADDRRPGGR